MAEFYGIQYLQKYPPGQVVIADVVASLRDIREKITIWTKLNDNESGIDGIHDLDQGDNVWMMACLMVELDFPLLELSLSRVQSGLIQCLDGVKDVGVDIDGPVDDAIRTNA